MGKMTLNKKILIFGGHGLLGSEISDFFGGKQSWDVVKLSRLEADITDESKVLQAISKHKPDVVINCAALINVEYCESNPFETFKINALGPGVIINAIRKSPTRPIFVHVSSSYVFGNEKRSFSEYDEPKPVNVYGWSKKIGEDLVTREGDAAGIKYFIIRTSWLYGQFRPTLADIIVSELKKGRVFEVIVDQWSVITSARDLCSGIEDIVSNRKYESGIYHFFDESDGGVTRFDLAKEVASVLGFDKKLLRKIKRSNIFKVSYPRSAVLLNTKFPPFPNWKTSLKEYLLKKYAKEKK